MGQSQLQTRRKNKKWLLAVGVILVISVMIALFIFLPTKDTVKTSSDNETSLVNEAENTTIENNPANNFDTKTNDSNPAPNNQDKPSTGPDYYYNLSLEQAGEKKYQLAIDYLTKAIELDSKRVEFYNKKSEFEVLLGQKTTAIETIKIGLANNPNDPILKNKLEILQTVVE